MIVFTIHKLCIYHLSIISLMGAVCFYHELCSRLVIFVYPESMAFGGLRWASDAFQVSIRSKPWGIQSGRAPPTLLFSGHQPVTLYWANGFCLWHLAWAQASNHHQRTPCASLPFRSAILVALRPPPWSRPSSHFHSPLRRLELQPGTRKLCSQSSTYRWLWCMLSQA